MRHRSCDPVALLIRAPIGATLLLGVLGACHLNQAAPSSGVKCVARSTQMKPPPYSAPMRRPGSDSVKHGDARGDSSHQSAATAPLLKPACPDGQVPVVSSSASKTSGAVLKGNPLLAADRTPVSLLPESLPALGERIRRTVLRFDQVYSPRSKRDSSQGVLPPDPSAPCDGKLRGDTCYYYGSAAVNREADGGGMTASIERPAFDHSGGSGHTLNEISVQGGAANGNIVELGWNVSSTQYPDAHPHLFVYHWKNWVPTCYDTCGWVQYSGTYYPGQDLNALVGRQVYIGYVYYQGNWWAWFDNQWLGYFPGTEWSDGYERSSLIQWFGEVASKNGVPPITDMGDGQFPPVPAAASMQTLCDVVAADWVCWYRDEQFLFASHSSDYDIARVSFGAVRYGGPGQ